MTRRTLLSTPAAATLQGAQAANAAPKEYRIGVISASIDGKPQRFNGHTWHFAQYLHPSINMDGIRKYLDPGSVEMFEKHVRNPKENFDALPFPDTRLACIYDADPAAGAPFAETFPGCEVVRSLDEMVKNVDAVWLGDASGKGNDHLALVGPGLQKGLPTFCDKPIGETVAGTKAILDLAKKHNAPLMSSSLFRHQWGMEQALRLRDSKELGELGTVLACIHAGYTPESWAVYGHHSVWSAITLMGPEVEAVSMFARDGLAQATLAYKGRKPAQVWYGRPDIGQKYSVTTAYFPKGSYEWTSAIEGNWWMGHHYEMFRMAAVFREMVRTRKEPIPHAEILAVTAVVRAALESAKGDSRLVPLGL